MFESVTKRRKNPIINLFGWALIIVVCVVFVFIGFSPNSSFLGQGGAAAQVNGDAISLREFKDLMDRLDSAGQGGQGREQRQKMEENAMNILVSRSLIVQEADKLNIHVSDDEVASELLSIEPFHVDGVFSESQYHSYLRGARLTASEFEDKIRRDLVIRKMSQLIGYASKEVELVDNFDSQIDQAQINVGYVKLSPSSVSVAAGKKAVAEFVANNEAKINTYYENHKSEYTQPEQVKARHILVKAKDDKAASMEEALKKVKEVAAKLTVDNFSEMAKKHSDDPGSKEKGGDLGFFTRGRMVPEFEKAAFSIEVGQITEPIQSQFGYHIIIVDEKKEASEQSLDSVKSQIAKKLIEDGAYEQALGDVKGLLKDKNFGELESYLSQNNLKWTNTGFFSITKEAIPGVGNNREFLDVALELSPEMEYSPRLVYQGESAYLLKYKGAKMDASNPQNSQMDFFKQLMKQQKMNMMVQTWTESLRAKASVKVNPELLR